MNYDPETVLRMEEIGELIKDGLLPFERMRILLEELLELRVNYDLFNQPLKICTECIKIKHACFYQKEEEKGFHSVCRYCRLVQAEINRKKTSIYHCPTCDTNLKVRNSGQLKFVVRKHKNTKKHKKSLRS